MEVITLPRHQEVVTFMYFFPQRKNLKAQDMTGRILRRPQYRTLMYTPPAPSTVARPVKMMEYHTDDLITHQLALS